MSTGVKPTSSYYATKFRESKENDAPFVKPESIPLDYGRHFYPFPYAFEPYPFEITVKWIWLNIVINRNFWLTLSATICGLLAIVLGFLARVKFNKVIAVFAGLFALASIVLIWFRINAAQNENHRRALCYLYEKKELATKIWSRHGESEQMYSKDVFYETSSFKGKFQVLRDGTVEVIPYATYEGTESGIKASVNLSGEAQIEFSSGPGNSHIKTSVAVPVFENS